MPQKQAAPPPVPSDAPKRRGRPPKPGGPTPQREIQRAYRARLAAAGKVVRIVGAAAADARAGLADMRERLHNALLKLAVRDEEVTRLRSLNARLGAERKRLERQITNLTKDKIVLADQLAKPSAGTSRRGRPANR